MRLFKVIHWRWSYEKQKEFEMPELRVVDGELDLASVEGLATVELREWVYRRLHGHDHQVGGDVRQGERPYYLLASIYQDLSRHVREDLQKIVSDAIDDMAENPETSWRGEAAHELLLLASDIGAKDVTEQLSDLAQDQKFFQSEEIARSEDVHFRILQTLIGLGWNGTAEFWQKQVELSPDRYTGLAFSALARHDLDGAFALLIGLDPSPMIIDSILNGLPYLFRRKGKDCVVPVLERYVSKLPEPLDEAIRRFCEEDGIPLPAEKEQGINLDLAISALRSRNIQLRPGRAALEKNAKSECEAAA